MFSLNSLSVQFNGIDLFKDISFMINPKDRIGLVGKNGVGKSTLLKIISGQMPIQSGKVVIPEGQSVGYLAQEITLASDKTILEETLSVFEAIAKMETEIEHINVQLAERTDYESEVYSELIVKLSELHEQINLLDPSKMESSAEKILKGLGFAEKDLERSVQEFSGGWQMRVELAKLLLKKPSLLLLDEPTNHLDIESILWLEGVLKDYPGAIIMISHDRMFLDNITKRTVEIVFGKFHDYKVPYSKYFELREERLNQQEAAFKNQQKHIAQQERFIEKFRAKSTKAKQVQSKMKQLEKIERVEFDELDTSSIQFHFPPSPRSGQVVIHGESVSKNYGSLNILKNLDFKIERGERIAFVGKNGEGKTTLVRLINAVEKYEGEITIGHNVKIGYYAQIQEKTLGEENTVYQVIENEATGEWAKVHKIRGLLGAFLFGEEDIDKKVKVLSGGEKSRLALAKLLLDPVNLLILDEPTNHLDIASKEILKNALLKYDGTLIVVSHDRDFLQGLTNKTYEFKNKQVKEHIGDINEFLTYHQVESFRAFEAEKEGQKLQQITPEKTEKKPNDYKKNKETQKQIRQLNAAIGKAEKKITTLENEIKSLEEKMIEADFNTQPESKDIFFKHAETQKQLDNVMQQWEELSEQLEKLN